MQKLMRKPVFWILQVLLFCLSTSIAVRFYPKAFPMVDLAIKMDRSGALQSAYQLATQYHWGPENFRQAASFDLDSQTQTFIELTGGGSAAFLRIIKEDLYSPYTWNVRHFQEGKTNETLIRFTPKGDFYGFSESLPETFPGPALSASAALQIAENSAKTDWGVNLSQFQLIEKSQETRPSHRVDHIFVYERPKIQMGEGKYRLKMVVSGDRLTALHYFIKIPDSFLRRYAEMRSSNNTISSISSVAMIILYFIGGCGIGIFFLARKRWLIWKTPLFFAGWVAGFQFLEQINHLPLIWMNYDTAISAAGFLMRNASSSVILFLAEFVMLSISFMAAESLSRKAFPKHPQFWRIWYPKNASSLAILGRTVGGYLSVGFFFAFVVLFYLFATQSLGWWSPSDLLFQPDSLATYCPWFTSIATSLHAGFWEESLFRAVPLASAALIGERFGHRRKWITAGFIIQALIFAAAHANYPAQPSYARVVELIIPSFLFGGFYLIFGLLPGIILHFTFDVISFAIPIFAASTPRIWIDRSLVILFTLMPLWIVLIARARTGKWLELSSKELNQAWHPTPVKSKVKTEDKPKKLAPLGQRTLLSLGVASFLSLAVWIWFIPFKNQAPSLEINRERAIQLAQAALNQNGIHLSSEWEPLAAVSGSPDEEDRFIWKSAGPDQYQQLMGHYLMPPAWLVRFVRFGTTVEERAEEYQVFLTQNGRLYRMRHELPEGRPGANLDENQARTIALRALEETYHLDPTVLKEVSSNASKLPHRKDWVFVFSDESIHLKSGEARLGLRVAGDQATASKRFIFIPEDWSRNERNRQNIITLLRTFSAVAILLIFGVSLIYALIQWTQKKFEKKVFLKALLLFSLLGLVNFLNQLPGKFAQFSTEEPKLHQFITLLSFGLVKVVFLSTCFAILTGYLHFQAHHRNRLALTHDWIVGLCTGILGTTVVTLASSFLPSPQKGLTWGKVDALNSHFPLLQCLNGVEKYIFVTILLCFISLFTDWITSGGSTDSRAPKGPKRNWIGILFLVVFSLALIGLEAQDLYEIPLLTAVAGGCVVIAYRYLLRGNFSLIPLSTFGMGILLAWKQASLHAYPGVGLESALTIILTGFIGFYWYWKLESLAEKRR